MTTTQTREVDRFGNVSYRIDRDGVTIGTVVKTSSGYDAEYRDNYVPTRSIRQARRIIEERT